MPTISTDEKGTRCKPLSAPSESRIIEKVKDVLDRAQSSDDRMRPRVTLAYAQSIDGCISANLGTTTQISDAGTLVVTHQLRAIHSALLVGVRTVLIDEPRLNVRHVSGADPIPIIVDSQLRTPTNARVFGQSDIRPIIATTWAANSKKAEALEESGASVLRVAEDKNGLVNLTELFKRLAKLNIGSVLVEGGAHVITNVMLERLADQLVLTISPIMLGGVRSVRDLCAVDIECRPRLKNTFYESIASDLMIYGEFDQIDR